MMVAVLVAMSRVMLSVIGTAIYMSATIGVRQRSPTSCLIFVPFVLFVNDPMNEITEGELWARWVPVMAARGGVYG